jgi:DUF917 family protein
MARIIKKENIVSILYGATLLGAGGGGSLSDGLKCLADLEADTGKDFECRMIDADEMADDQYAGVIAGTGSPAVLKQVHWRAEGVNAFNALKHICFFEGKDINYLISGEQGGFATFTPFLVCSILGMDVVDACCCGRAVPGLDATLANVHGIPTSPLVVSSKEGNTIVAFPKDPFDGKRAENIQRNYVQSQGWIAAFGTWICSRDDIKNKIAFGEISFAETVGEQILAAKAEGGGVAEYVARKIPCRELCTGVITKKTLEKKAGWDWGYNEITTDDGKKFYIDFKNENIVARDESGKVYMTAPDHISVIETTEYLPLSNSDTEEGQRVSVLLLPVHEAWWTTPKGAEVWQPYFDTVGYTGDGPVRF